MMNQLQKTFNLVPSIETQLKPQTLAAIKLYEHAIKLTEDKILKMPQLDYDANAYSDAYTASINALFSLNASL